MKLKERGIEDRIIYIDQSKNTVSYLYSHKTRTLKNPEEVVQLTTYLKLIYHFKYPPELIKVCETVKMGSATKEADIIVYKDYSLKTPYLIVECKKQGVSKRTFKDAIEQGFSYAISLNASFLWVTDQSENSFFKVLNDQSKEREKNIIHKIPSYQQENSFQYKVSQKFFKGLKRLSILLKSTKKINAPFAKLTLLYVGIITFFHLILSKICVEFHQEIYSVTKWFWENLDMTFQWIFNGIGILAITLGLTFTNLFLKSQHTIILKKKKNSKKVSWLSILLFSPIWYSGYEQVPSWWNYGNFQRLEFKTFIYTMPFFESLPFLIPLTFGLIWIIQKFGK